MNASVDNRDPYMSAHSRRLWFAILLALSAWLLQELAGWLLSDFACANADLTTGTFNATTLRITQIAISVAALALSIVALSIVALSIGVRGWRATRDLSREATHRGQFVAALALLLSAAFTLGVVFAAVGPWLLPLCERGR